MEPWIGSTIKEKKTAKRLELAHSRLRPGEALVGIFACDSIRPLVDLGAVTSERVLGLTTGRDPVRLEVDLARVVGVETLDAKLGGKALMLLLEDRSKIRLGKVNEDDADELQRLLEPLISQPEEGDVDDAPSPRDQELKALIPLVVGYAGKRQLREIRRQCRGNELPSFIIADGMHGALAAFTDRCTIVKKGGLTSYMSGSLGQGRVTIFPYRKITGIEWNGGMLQGVLEILTPSYQGTANKDYWKGSTRSFNADSNNPMALSNTLPLRTVVYKRARGRIDQLQTMILEAQGSPAENLQRPAPTASLADELSKLAALRDQGILAEDEFLRAKRRLLERDHGH